MARVRPGMIQRLETYTSKLKEKDQGTVLRLHKGKIKKGAYKGTRKGRLKNWAICKLSEKARKKRLAYLSEVTTGESKALAGELCKDISRRTPVVYKADKRISSKDVATLLSASKEERETFSELVEDFVATATKPSLLHNDPMKSAKQRLNQHLMNRSITRHDQMKQLQKEVIASLKTKSRYRKSKRPMLEGTAQREKRLKKYKKMKRAVIRAVDEKMPTLALLQESEQYAYREQVAGMSGVSRPVRREGKSQQVPVKQSPIGEGEQTRILEEFAQITPGTTRKHIALMAAEHMLGHGYIVDPADLPKTDTSENQAAMEKRITTLKKSRNRWKRLVGELLEGKRYEEAVVVEKISQDSLPLQALEELRDKIADTDFQEDQKARRKAARKGKTRSRKSPGLKKKRPQIMPWRGGHTVLETEHAKQLIEPPTQFDGNMQDKAAVIQQTLSMLKGKYPELADKHTKVDLEEVRQYLERHVTDRTLRPVSPFRYIKRPLAEATPPSLVELEDDDTLVQILHSDSMSTQDSDTPQFNMEGMTDIRDRSVSEASSTSTASVRSTDSLLSPRTLSLTTEDEEGDLRERERSLSQDSGVVMQETRSVTAPADEHEESPKVNASLPEIDHLVQEAFAKSKSFSTSKDSVAQEKLKARAGTFSPGIKPPPKDADTET